ncbi:hypothetical protein C3629_16230 [Salmonella enterica]|nr:hypothetical protein [Salmonella enterica]ECD8735701.1 hypothetical protein [Salmonella enterica]EDC4507920.1 hypothetical protein [Salmonella enterica]EDV7868172.1 hypothetical protein [Salmonella enterica subsp. enterica serovar 4,[5],12:i:-]
MNIVLMLSSFNLNITLLVQADLVNGSNEVRIIDRDTLQNALCLPGDRIMTMLSLLLSSVDNGCGRNRMTLAACRRER